MHRKQCHNCHARFINGKPLQPGPKPEDGGTRIVGPSQERRRPVLRDSCAANRPGLEGSNRKPYTGCSRVRRTEQSRRTNLLFAGCLPRARLHHGDSVERKEAQDIVVSAVALAVAFALADNGGLSGIDGLSLYAVGMFLASVSSGFVLHELCHRFVARAYGAYAEYRMWNTGIVAALALSLFGVIFAAPGAVYIQSRADIWGRTKAITRSMNGIISIAGPASNVFIALAFFLLGGYLGDVAVIGARVNLQLALFNMIPFPPLDGSKVFAWDAKFWVLCFLLILATTTAL